MGYSIQGVSNVMGIYIGLLTTPFFKKQKSKKTLPFPTKKGLSQKYETALKLD
jgi:hypothetical protein